MLKQLLKDIRGSRRIAQSGDASPPAPALAHVIDSRLAAADELVAAGRYAEAEAHYRDALRERPDAPAVLHALGVIAHRLGDPKRAVDLYDAAIGRDPRVAIYHNNCGEAHRALIDYPAAIACYRKAIALDAAYADPHLNLGLALQAQGKLGEAIVALETAVSLNPQDAQTRFALAVALLAAGDYERGWREYRWRHATPASGTPQFPGRPWNGDRVPGGTILLYSEQGYGDAIQFVRYAPLVAERCGRVLLKCHPALERLFTTVSDRVELVATSQPLPHYDAHASLLDLPSLFETTLESVPALVPYLKPAAERVRAWRDKLESPPGWLRVGIAWAGSPQQANDRNRSCTLAHFSALAGVERVAFYGLQKHRNENEPDAQGDALALIDVTPDIRDFADTAAIVANLDLVITVDTALAHLAGALAKPVWTLLSEPAAWQWLTARGDSPWYPTMRLFRQPTPGAWAAVFREAAAALEAKAREARRLT